jgi:Transposase DDE domain
MKPLIDKLRDLPKKMGRVKRARVDNGYLSGANVKHCAGAQIEPLIAMKRERHNTRWHERFAKDLKAPLDSDSPMRTMAHRLNARRGKALYSLRKQTPEPAFGIIKSVMGFRQFLLRGLDNAKGEWNLVTMSWNIRRIFALGWRVRGNSTEHCAHFHPCPHIDSVMHEASSMSCSRLSNPQTQSDRLLAG